MTGDAHVYTDEDGAEISIDATHLTAYTPDTVEDAVVALPDNEVDRWRLARALIGDLGELRLLAPDEAAVPVRHATTVEIAAVIRDAGIGGVIARQLAQEMQRRFLVFPLHHATPEGRDAP